MADNQKRSCQRLTTTNSLSPSIIFAATNIDSSSSPSYFFGLNKIFYPGLSEPGGRGEGLWSPYILADQLTLTRPGGKDYACHITTCPIPFGFSDLRTAMLPAPQVCPYPCILPAFVLTGCQKRITGRC